MALVPSAGNIVPAQVKFLAVWGGLAKEGPALARLQRLPYDSNEPLRCTTCGGHNAQIRDGRIRCILELQCAADSFDLQRITRSLELLCKLEEWFFIDPATVLE